MPCYVFSMADLDKAETQVGNFIHFATSKSKDSPSLSRSELNPSEVVRGFGCTLLSMAT